MTYRPFVLLSPLVAVALVLAACNTTVYPSNIREARASEVAGCRHLGRVRGIPGVYGPLKDIGLKDARRSAKVKANDVGANTIVFDPVPADEQIFEIGGEAYSC